MRDLSCPLAILFNSLDSTRLNLLDAGLDAVAYVEVSSVRDFTAEPAVQVQWYSYRELPPSRFLESAVFSLCKGLR